MLRFALFVIITATICTPLSGQKKVRSDTAKWNTFAGLPVVYYLPETNWGFGAAGIYAFRFKKYGYDQRPSLLRFVGSYTLNKQLVSLLSYNLFPKKGAYNLKGEFGYYQFSYDFFGIGKNASKDDIETFGVNYPRLEINALKRFKQDWFFGLRYRFNDYEIVKVVPNGLLAASPIPGNSGAVISSLGTVAIFDNRDNVFATYHGLYIESSMMFNGNWLGSDFNYQRFTLDASTYFTDNKNRTLALNGYVMLINGEAPFNELALLGGSRRARGYYPGRFRDNQLWLLQAEYRFPILWWLGMAVFSSYGTVAQGSNDLTLQDFKWNYGGGLRFTLNKEDRINLRVDAAFGKDTSAFYFTVGEAF